VRCKNCNYPLWNIVARRCPECGLAFVPSDFTFVLNSVRFCCPHCTQDYYGTSPNGQLVPSEFECVRCHAHIRADECVLQPTAGVSERQTVTEINPWVERRARSWVSALATTVGRAVGSPVQLLKQTPPESSSPRALAFYIIVNTLSVFVGASFFFAFMLVPIFAGGNHFSRFSAAALGWTIASILAFFAGMIASLLIWVASAHLVLRITGPVAHPFKRTFQTFAYTSGVNIFSAIPCLGMYASSLTWLWWMIAAACALQHAQNVEPWRSVLAALLLPGLILLAAIAIVAATFYGLL
jgi:hypothetical protein